ncbi:BppU family phage baseplate upper protein [Staphylococcus delphini]|uniref:BppU family phage baseplate upper protein n=1 Tax=Staphylococcus delphini TaxID=53344 RepID=UPI0021D2FD9A|nr:BppU family phage baseplate upper protein [Staphylococcus delphini]UXS43733.1 BppU family phage baseplate upper protein [Staphylococcus delphini]UXV46334.1 BppU family phage baseplate upper protein [Staphylococcus delphini]
MSNLDKIAVLKQENTPYYKPISETRIGFYNTDSNTAKLRFIVHKNGFPYQLGPVNVVGYLWLKSSNGSMSGQLDLSIYDAHGGIVEVTVPNEFLKAATDTNVEGQILLAVNGNTDVATLGKFEFYVADALPNQVKGEVKVQYFRMFDDLKNALEKEVAEIKESLQNLDDHVTQVRDARDQALQQFEVTKEKITSGFESLYTRSSSELVALYEQQKRDTEQTKNTVIAAINSKADESTGAIENKKQETLDYIESKVAEFSRNSPIGDAEVDFKLEALNWQKYKLTNDDGSAQTISLSNNVESLHNLKPGNYYFTDTPITGASSTTGFANVDKRGEIVKRIVFQPYNSTQVWLKRFYNSWSDWELVNIKPSDTGWLPLNLINGVQSYGDTYVPHYKLVNNNGDITLKLKGAVSNITTNDTVIATLPGNIAKLITSTCSFTQNSSIKNSSATTARWTVSTNGEIKMERASFAVSEMKSTDWYPIHTVLPL